MCLWELAKSKGIILGVPIIRIMVFGSKVGPIVERNYYFRDGQAKGNYQTHG